MVALDSAPWVEKYRPDTLDDVAAHKEIISTSTWRVYQRKKCVWLLDLFWERGKGGGYEESGESVFSLCVWDTDPPARALVM